MQIITLGLNPAIDRIAACDALAPGTHQSVKMLARIPAGKSANVSRALALLGHDSLATGFMGRDEAEFFTRGLSGLSPGTVRSSWIMIDAGTRENLTILETTSGRETHLRESGFRIDRQNLIDLYDKLVRLIDPGDMVVMAGSLPPDVSHDDLAEIINLLASRAARVAVDTSGPALGITLKSPFWLAKPNLNELAEALGVPIDNDPHAILEAVRSAGLATEYILVSRGECGAMLIETRLGGHAWTSHAPSLWPVVRTVGCGDHLLAGFLSAGQRGMDAPTSLGFAVALATARAVSRDYEYFDSARFSELSGRTKVELLC